jgi:hypothetical protein
VPELRLRRCELGQFDPGAEKGERVAANRSQPVVLGGDARKTVADGAGATLATAKLLRVLPLLEVVLWDESDHSGRLWTILSRPARSLCIQNPRRRCTDVNNARA